MRKRILLAAALLGLSSTVLAERKCGGFSTQYSAIDEICPYTEGLAAISIGPGWGFLDRAGRMAIEPKFDDVGLFSQGLAPAARDDKWGFIDTHGEWRIPAAFDAVQGFHEGLAVARTGDKTGYLDQQGHWAIAPQYIDAEDFVHGVAVVSVKYGHDFLIDRSGKVVRDFGPGHRIARVQQRDRFIVTRSFDSVLFNIDGTRVPLTGELENIESFDDGLALKAVTVGDERRYGALDLKGHWVIPPTYDNLESFKDGLAIARRGEKYGLIDKQGRVVIDFKYDVIDHEGAHVLAQQHDGNFALFDRKGQSLSAGKCESANLVREGDWTYLHGCSEFLAIYRDGKPLRLPLANADVTRSGALLFLQSGEEKNQFAIIGPEGVLLSSEDPAIKGQYDSARPVFGRGPVNDAKPDLLPLALLVKDYEKVAILTRDHRIVTRPEWKYDSDLLEYQYDNDAPRGGPMLMHTDAGIGAIDGNGRWVVEPGLHRMRRFEDGVAIGLKDDQTLIIDDEGHTKVLPDDVDFEGVSSPYTYVLRHQDAEGNTVRTAYNLKTGTSVTQTGTDQIESSEFHEGLAAAELNDHWGLKNAAGAWVLAAEYDERPHPESARADDKFLGWTVTRTFKDVCDDCEGHGFVSPQGRVIVAPVAHQDVSVDEQGVLNITIATPHSPRRTGLMTQDARLVLPIAYDDLRSEGGGWYQIKPVDHEGVIDARGEWTVPLAAYHFEDMARRAYTVDDSGPEVRLIHVDGQISTPSKPATAPDLDDPTQWFSERKLVDYETVMVFRSFDWKERLRVAGAHSDEFSEGMLPIDSKARRGFPTAFVTAQGKIIGPLPYAETGDMHEGLATIRQTQPAKGRKAQSESEDEEAHYLVGYIDRNGKVAIAPKFDAGSGFKEERATVILKDNVGVIDTKGQLLVRGAWRCESEPVLIDGKGKVVWPQDGKTKCK